MHTFRNFYVPDHMMDGIERYVEHGINPGHFLTAIITNDLRETIGRADDENLQNIPAYVDYFYDNTPASCWGSPEQMGAWVARFAETAS